MAAWSANPGAVGTRRGLQVALGLTWLLDAALQYQPFMFGQGFVTQVLAPAQSGNPQVVSGPALAAGHLIAHNVAVGNAAFATVQLALAIGLLWRPAVKAALAGSVAWSLAVWWLGEGLGGVLTGSATPVTGAPGAAILYAFLAVLVWPTRTADSDNPSVADGSPLGALWSRVGWFALWASAAYLVLQPLNRAPGALHHTIAGLVGGEPGWIAAMDYGVAAAVGSDGAVTAVVAALAALVACGVFAPVAARPALVLAALLAIATWVLGENFGGIFTGQATDPSTGPLLVLLAIAFWPRKRVRNHHAPVLHTAVRLGNTRCSPADSAPIRRTSVSK